MLRMMVRKATVYAYTVPVYRKAHHALRAFYTESTGLKWASNSFLSYRHVSEPSGWAGNTWERAHTRAGPSIHPRARVACSSGLVTPAWVKYSSAPNTKLSTSSPAAPG